VSTVYFHEDQYFRQSWLWVLITVPVFVAAVASAASAQVALWSLVVTLVVGALVAVLFIFARLETEVRGDAVVIRFRGLWPTRTIPLADIEGVEARRYSIWDSGGWGVHLTFGGMAYNVSGNEGVFIHLRKGKGSRVLVGSQRADELARAIRTALAAPRSA
jgi:hypothetical protein